MSSFKKEGKKNSDKENKYSCISKAFCCGVYVLNQIWNWEKYLSLICSPLKKRLVELKRGYWTSHAHRKTSHIFNIFVACLPNFITRSCFSCYFSTNIWYAIWYIAKVNRAHRVCRCFFGESYIKRRKQMLKLSWNCTVYAIERERNFAEKYRSRFWRTNEFLAAWLFGCFHTN